MKVLSIDGGGVRGIIPALWLEHLQHHLPLPLHHYFDVLVGVSTGSALVCAIAAGLPVEGYDDLYTTYGRTVFPAWPKRLWSRFLRTFTQGFSAPKYDDEGLEKSLKEVFGDMTLGELKLPVNILTYNTKRSKPVVLKSHQERFKDIPVWLACKASMSAPTYLPATLIDGDPFIDGGVVDNSPVLCGIAEGLALGGSNLEDFLVVSFGTGDRELQISAKKATRMGLLQWAKPIIKVVFDGGEDARHYIARQLLRDAKYVRVQTKAPKSRGMDDSSKKHLKALRAVAVKKIQDTDVIPKLAQALLEAK